MIKNIQDVKNVDIKDVIGREIELKASGASFKACCPFHGESSPSFHVHRAKGIYKCFGCGEAGDGIDFIMKLKSYTFIEAVEYIAKEHHVRLDIENNEKFQEEREEQRKEKQEIESLYLLNAWVAERYFAATYSDPLFENDSHIALEKRPLSRATIDKFGICYTGEAGFIRAESMQLSYGLEPLLKLGILREGKNGTYDFFHHRHLFPIRNKAGKVAGFAGRKESTDQNKDNPKYLNSPESKIYKKNEILYGLFENRQNIAKAEVNFEQHTGFAYIVEGYMDVVTMYDFEIRNAVAPCGTSLTVNQIAELKKITNTVVLCFDQDSAGKAAAIRSIELLVAAQFKIEILHLPTIDNKKQDPDSFLRSTPNATESWTKILREDAIEFIILDGFNQADPFSKNEKMQLAAKLLAMYDSQTIVNAYIEKLCEKYIFGNVKKELGKMIESCKAEFIAKQSNQSNRDLDIVQTQDVLRYGIYEKNHKYYYTSTPDSEGFELTNFCVKPLMLIIGNKRSLRLLEITNEYGYKTTIEIDSDEIIEMGSFKKMVARKGNFTFSPFCKPEMYARIYSKISDNTHNAFPILTMGHSRENFYAFSNGIVTEKGFLEVDEYGIVNHQDTKYYLAAYSKVRMNIKGDESGYSYEDIKPYYYPTDVKKSYSLEDWTRMVHAVYGPNGIVAAAWFMASIFRDLIHNRFKMFPHLNLFGVPQSGKNQLAGTICAMFGKPQPPIGLENATKHAMTQLVSVIRNGVVWFDEYKNDVDRQLVELLKGFADGTGRKKGDASTDRGIVSTPVNAACIISGQHQLTLDLAMFSRVISLNFDKTEYSDEARDRLKRLQEIEESAVFTHITAEIYSHREWFETKFHNSFERIRREFVALLPPDAKVSDRVLNMYSIPLVASELIREKMNLGFKTNELMDALMTNILSQKQSMSNENEVAVWWRLIDFLLSTGQIEHGKDVLVEVKDRETYNKDWKGQEKIDKEYLEIDDMKGKKLLYINFTRSHPEYMKRHNEERKVKGLDKDALMLYLKTSEAFEGMKMAKKFDKLTTRTCLVFDVDKLPFTIPYSFEVFAAKRTKVDDLRPDIEPIMDNTPAPY